MAISISPKLFALVVMSVGLAGCMKPNPLIFELADEGGSDDTSDSTGDGDEDTGLPAPLDIPDAEALACEPLDVFELECGSCLSVDCCAPALACDAIEDCACLAACRLAGDNNGTCQNACNDAKANMPELASLLTCAEQACEPVC